jgi:hypothetical protein
MTCSKYVSLMKYYGLMDCYLSVNVAVIILIFLLLTFSLLVLDDSNTDGRNDLGEIKIGGFVGSHRILPEYSIDEIKENIKPDVVNNIPVASFNSSEWPPSTMIPNVFVLGAPKAATSSLHKWLSFHPLIRSPTLKEPMFFSSLPNETLAWYASLFPKRDQNQGQDQTPVDGGVNINGNGTYDVLTLDASTRNLAWCTAPATIKMFSDTFKIRPKFIISLRDPVSACNFLFDDYFVTFSLCVIFFSFLLSFFFR